MRDQTSDARPSRGVLGSTIEVPRRIRGVGFDWDHEIQIALPRGYFRPENAQRAYPVLWATDGSWTFDLAVGVVNVFEKHHIPDAIVVGIGVPLGEEDRWYEPRRIYEFLSRRPAPVARDGSRLAEREVSRWVDYEARLAAAGTPLGYGGVEAFLNFLITDLRVALARDYRMMSDENVLFGYSAGATLCVHALFMRPGAFNGYICGGGVTVDALDSEAAYADGHNDLNARLFVGVGERDLLHDGPSSEQLGPILASRRYPSLRMSVRIFPDDDHASAVPGILSRGLRFVWQESRPAGRAV